MDQEPKPVTDNQTGSLETPETVVESPAGGTHSPSSGQPPAAPGFPDPGVVEAPGEPGQTPPPVKKPSRIGKLFKSVKLLNIYLLIFVLILIVALGVTFAAYQKAHPDTDETEQKTSQAINQKVLDQLRNADVTIGQPKQILTVEANAVFSGSVLIHGDFETAGQIKSEGAISASDANISGTGTFGTVQAKKLQVSGDLQLQGNVNVQGSLSVSGSGNFAGTLSASKLNVQSLELGGNLVLSRHLDTAGGTPSKSNGGALGGGGTSSISGTDTAGTITINTGNSPSSGCFVSVSFIRSFDSPRVVVTPVGSAGGSIDYYVTRTSGGFSLCTSSPAGAHKNFSFDYIVID